ncbi:MAG TPA: hypothetical protein DDY14_00285, partial [Chromatiaceae bacterium]|nr:hypothetical protein [Chromatiaceae bacterium]
MRRGLLRQLHLQIGDQIVAPAFDLVLSIKQRPPYPSAPLFQLPLLLLPVELFLKCNGDGGGA